MSTGGIFQLISNDGHQDKILCANTMLKKSIQKFKEKKIAILKSQNPSASIESIMKSVEYVPLSQIETTHNVFVKNKFKPYVKMASEYSKTLPTKGVAKLGNKFSFTIPKFGEFLNDTVVHVKLKGLKALNPLDKVRYVEFLGHKLMKNVKMIIGNNVIDEYDSENYNTHYQYKVPINKKKAYLKNIGQEIPKKGYLTADPVNDQHREYRYFGDGPQTYKVEHDEVELWIPLLFWFSKIENALPNVILNTQQTDIDIHFEEAINLISFADYGGGGEIKLPEVSECSLFVNHLFLEPDIANLILKNKKFEMIRVHKTHKQELISNTNDVKLQQLKWPIESLYITFKPKTNLLHSQKWHKKTFIKEKNVMMPVVTNGNVLQLSPAQYYEEIDLVKNLSLRASDIVIYPNNTANFYANYMPYKTDGSITPPEESGYYLINFIFNSDEKNPNGHFNVSRSRELYLNYVSNVDPDTDQNIISIDNPTLLNVQADCINFILIQNGTAVLRYST